MGVTELVSKIETPICFIAYICDYSKLCAYQLHNYCNDIWILPLSHRAKTILVRFAVVHYKYIFHKHFLVTTLNYFHDCDDFNNNFHECVDFNRVYRNIE